LRNPLEEKIGERPVCPRVSPGQPPLNKESGGRRDVPRLLYAAEPKEKLVNVPSATRFPPSRVMQELIECRDDDRFKLLQNNLENILRFEGVRTNAESFIVERYIRGECSIHIHSRITFDFGEQWDFCTVLQSPDSGDTAKSIGVRRMIVNGDSRNHDVKMFVLVDVRKLADDPKNIVSSWPTVVRLYTLDECISRFGNVRQGFVKDFLRDRDWVWNSGIAKSGNFEHERELAISLPSFGEGLAARIGLDEVEREVVEGRFELINNLPNDYEDVSGSPDKEVHRVFAVRILDDFIRVSFLS